MTTGLVSKRPNFVQQARSTVFLDAATGDLAVRDRVVRLDLGARTPGEILDAVLTTAPARSGSTSLRARRGTTAPSATPPSRTRSLPG
ncbi:hypothetical protein [Kitasatospora griseola]|uniref:hypothetical protein n=1 Tax=Kitasatospora griseola TaxID=2064 RepID=UPI0006986551|nr:hypothetical protein [Kitasatospora griseola]